MTAERIDVHIARLVIEGGRRVDAASLARSLEGELALALGHEGGVDHPERGESESLGEGRPGEPSQGALRAVAQAIAGRIEGAVGGRGGPR